MVLQSDGGLKKHFAARQFALGEKGGLPGFDDIRAQSSIGKKGLS